MEIVEQLARERRVERMVESMTGEHGHDTADLAQMVYCILLEYRAECIVDLWNGGRQQMNNFLFRVIQHQYYSRTSPFYKLFGDYNRRWVATFRDSFEDAERIHIKGHDDGDDE